MTGQASTTDRLARLAPGLFVFFWSTGFVVAHYATDDAGPLTFLALRVAIVTAVLGAYAFFTQAPRLTRPQIGWSLLSGVLMHAVYLGGVFVAIDHGLPSGVSALVAGLHPVVTSLAAGPLLGERLARRQWIGVLLGFVGVAAVVVDRLVARSTGITAGGLVAVSCGMLGISTGTLLQRHRAVSVPLLWGTVTQYAAAAVVLGTGAVAVEHVDIRFTARTLFALLWAVVILSVVAVLIMLWLLQRRAAALVSSLFFLTPALSTIEGAILFDERIGLLAGVGLAVSLAGVWLVTRVRRT